MNDHVISGEYFLKLVPDTSVVIDGRITTLIDTGEYNGAQIIIPEAVVAELEAQANQGREIGFSGLTELQELCKLAERGIISIEFYGERPTLEQVKLASGGEIDSLIRKVAITHGARFITSDVVQSEVAKAKGLDVLYLRPQVEDFTPLAIDQFFDEYTIAVYLKERAKPMVRRGTIGKTETFTARDTLCTEYELRSMAQEILERAKRDPDGFIEIEKRGVTVVQIGSMRISIARRPFSDGMEITAVRPIVDLSLQDYSQVDIIKKILTSEKPGVLITGTPGCGKTTLAQAIATYLSDSGCIVKTMEQPREMQVPDQITQYTALDGSMVNTADVMLLVRPDYVIFDELRKNDDFDVFADLRLAGIGMVGILHAVSPLEALQRMAYRIDFSALSQVFGSLIYMKDGQIQHIYSTSFSMKIPEGADNEMHIRPVTTLSELQTGEVAFEIFKFGTETVVLPIAPVEEEEAPAYEPPQETGKGLEPEKAVVAVTVVQNAEPQQSEDESENEDEDDESSTWEVTERDIQREIGRYSNGEILVEMLSATKAVVYIDDRDVPAAIGKGGKNIAAIVNKVGVGIDIRPASELAKKAKVSAASAPVEKEELNLGEGLQVRIDKKQLSIISSDNTGKIVDVFAGREYLFTATVNDSGEIHLAKNSTIAQEMLRRYNEGEPIRLKTV